MTKHEIALKIASELDGVVPAQIVKDILQRFLDEIIEALAKEKRLELRNFGVFEVRERQPRLARNPKTGDKVFLEPHTAVKFSAGKVMLEKTGGVIKATPISV
jgi:integration host factor subunit beta